MTSGKTSCSFPRQYVVLAWREIAQVGRLWRDGACRTSFQPGDFIPTSNETRDVLPILNIRGVTLPPPELVQLRRPNSGVWWSRKRTKEGFKVRQCTVNVRARVVIIGIDPPDGRFRSAFNGLSYQCAFIIIGGCLFKPPRTPSLSNMHPPYIVFGPVLDFVSPVRILHLGVVCGRSLYA